MKRNKWLFYHEAIMKGNFERKFMYTGIFLRQYVRQFLAHIAELLKALSHITWTDLIFFLYLFARNLGLIFVVKIFKQSIMFEKPPTAVIHA